MKKIILPLAIAASLSADQEDICTDLMRKTHSVLADYKSNSHLMSKVEVTTIKQTIKTTIESCNEHLPVNTMTSLENVYKSIK